MQKTKKDMAMEKAIENEFDVEISDNILMSTYDGDIEKIDSFRKKIETFLTDIQYNESWGIKGKAQKMPERTQDER